MPFGVSPTRGEIQRRIGIALECLQGQKAMADDIPVFEERDTDKGAHEDHYMKTTTENTACVCHGVPQGSIVFWVLLFIAFINDLPLHVSSAQIDLYADDTTVTSTANYEESVKCTEAVAKNTVPATDSRAYLPLAKQDDNQEGWSVADTRSPTKVETEYLDLTAFVPIRKPTLFEIKSDTEVDAEL
ncbi:hypothetical protein ACROYT_G011170 [Oculina patagonica]